MTKDLKSTVSGKNVLIFGLGLQGGGVGDANFLKDLGANVRVSDLKSEADLSEALSQLKGDIEVAVGGHNPEDVEWADIIVRNPGVPWEHSHIQAAISSGKTVWVSAAVFVEYSPIPVIGITGTRGKSTTTNLVYEILDAAYPGQILLGGNVPGISTMSLLAHTEGKKFVVLELSSWQLQGFAHQSISPGISLITNLFEDHLNRYPDMPTYVNDKLQITAFQRETDVLFLNRDNPTLSKQDINTAAKTIWFSASELPSDLSTPLLGQHNLENIAAAFALCRHLGISSEIILDEISKFKGLPFRLEVVGKAKARTFINDTTSTTPTSTLKAIHSISGPLVLILGGASKNLDISDLIDDLCTNSKVKKIVVLGSSKLPELLSELMRCREKIVNQVFSMKEAVQSAYSASSEGDTIVLSPGFASFDLFKNEFDRGRQFNAAVKEIIDA